MAELSDGTTYLSDPKAQLERVKKKMEGMSKRGKKRFIFVQLKEIMLDAYNPAKEEKIVESASIGSIFPKHDDRVSFGHNVKRYLGVDLGFIKSEETIANIVKTLYKSYFPRTGILDIFFSAFSKEFWKAMQLGL